MPVTLSRHKQWTPIDLSDMGKSGYAKGTSRHKGRQMGMDILTGRRMEPQLQAKWDQFEKRFAGVNYGTGGPEFRRKIREQRELERQTLSAGYTLADIGKEQYVGGGMAGWGHWLPKVESMGWAYDAELGTWKHSSWGDDVSWGDYQDVGYDQYLKGLPAADAGVLEALVVDQHRVLSDVGHIGDTGLAALVEHHATLTVGAEANGLAVFQRYQHRRSVLLRGDIGEGAVVEDVAILVDLHERTAGMVVRPTEGLHHVLAVHVVGTGDEAGLGAEREADRVERRVEGPERRRLGDLADLARR